MFDKFRGILSATAAATALASVPAAQANQEEGITNPGYTTPTNQESSQESPINIVEEDINKRFKEKLQRKGYTHIVILLSVFDPSTTNVSREFSLLFVGVDTEGKSIEKARLDIVSDELTLRNKYALNELVSRHVARELESKN